MNERKSQKNIVLLNTSFPYGKVETFLEEELEYYKDMNVYIFNCNKQKFSNSRIIKNHNVHLLKEDQLSSFALLLRLSIRGFHLRV